MPCLRAAEALSASLICLFSTVSTLSSKCGELQTPSLHVSHKAGDFEEHAHTHFESHIVIAQISTQHPHNIPHALPYVLKTLNNAYSITLVNTSTHMQKCPTSLGVFLW